MYHKLNKHTVSIAEAIHVPYRPQKISKRHNSERIHEMKKVGQTRQN